MTNANALATVEAREAHPLVVGIQQRMPAIAQMLPAGMDAERFQRVALQAIIKQPDILQCSPESVIAAIVEAAQDGLEPTGARGGAHLVKFGNEAVLIRDYRGVIRIIIESGAATRVDAHVVRHGDEFSLDQASPDPVVHRPNIDAEGEARGYYALFWLPDGTKKAEYMSVGQIEEVRATSRGKDSMGWTKFFDQMARKTVIKRGANYLNLRPDIRERLMREDAAEFEGQVISVERDERLATARGKIHERAARLTGGEASTSAARPMDAPMCRHPQDKHQVDEQGVFCSECSTRLAARETPAAEEGMTSAPATARTASSPPGGSSVPAPTTLPEATARVGALALQHRLVTALDTDEQWDAFDDVLRTRGMEPPPLEERPEAIAEWNALGDRIAAGELDGDPAGMCQVHQLPWKFVPAGTNRAGKAFRSFWTCPDRDCSAKPTKAWRDTQPQKAGEEVPA